MSLACLPLLLFAAPPLELPALLDEVARQAPSVLAQQAALEAVRAEVGVAGAWEDPTFSVMVEDVPLGKAMEGMGEVPEPMFTYRLMQPLNVFGRRGLAKGAAQARVRAAQAQRRRVASDARAQAADAFFELWMSHEMERLIDRQLDLLERMRDSAKARYASGAMMAHHDFLRAEAELASMRAERVALASERVAIAAMLNVLRGRPPGAEVGEPVRPAPTPIAALPQVLERAPTRPELEQMRAMVEEMAARRALARRMALPMPMLGAFYQQRLGMPDAVGGELAFSLPLWFWDRQANEVAMAQAMVRRAEAELAAMTAMTQSDLRSAWSRARSLELRLEALEGTALPKLREVVASSQSAYVTGTLDFLRLLEAAMALQALEAQRLEAVAELERARFQLDRLLGEAAQGALP